MSLFFMKVHLHVLESAGDFGILHFQLIRRKSDGGVDHSVEQVVLQVGCFVEFVALDSSASTFLVSICRLCLWRKCRV